MKALNKQNFKNILNTGVTRAIRIDWSEEQWADYLREGLQNTLESLLEAGKRIYEFKTECTTVQGGSDFSKRASELLGISESYAREWAKVGERYQLLASISDKLPTDTHIIKSIAAQSIEKITWAAESGFIYPEMKREDMGVIRKYDPDKVEEEEEALNEDNSTTVSASSDGGTGGSTVSEISFTDESDDQSGAGTSEAHKEKSDDKSSVDPAFKLLEKALENSCYGEIQFSYFNIPGHNCEIVMSLDSYAGLMTLVAKILQFDNEQEDAQEADPNQGFLDLGYQKQTFIPAKRDNTDSSDPLYEQAVTITQVTQRCSVSALQRKLQVGYNRAFRIVKQMEETGIVSELKANGLREVLPFYEKDEIQGEQ